MNRVIVPCLLAFATVAHPTGAEPPKSSSPGLVLAAQDAVQRAIGQSGGRPTSTPGETAAAGQDSRPPAPPRPAPPRRRGSMVGYVDDGTIESRVRIRFDSAFENTSPDRAEFFYAKCGCYRDLPPSNPNYDADAAGPRGGVATDVDFRQLFLEAEFALQPRVSVFGQIPVRWLQPQSFAPGLGAGFDNQQGLSDVRAGVKFGLADAPAGTATMKVQLYLPTGDSAKGLGTNHATIEPTLLARQDVSDIVTIESMVGVWLPIGGSAPLPTSGDGTFAGRVFMYGAGPSFTVYDRNGTQFAPVVELVGWRVLDGNVTAGDDDASANIVNLKFGGRLNYGRGSIYVGYGHALTDTTWYDDVLRFEYRYSF